jgi:hypothetical protein
MGTPLGKHGQGILEPLQLKCQTNSVSAAFGFRSQGGSSYVHLGHDPRRGWTLACGGAMQVCWVGNREAGRQYGAGVKVGGCTDEIRRWELEPYMVWQEVTIEWGVKC